MRGACVTAHRTGSCGRSPMSQRAAKEMQKLTLPNTGTATGNFERVDRFVAPAGARRTILEWSRRSPAISHVGA